MFFERSENGFVPPGCIQLHIALQYCVVAWFRAEVDSVLEEDARLTCDEEGRLSRIEDPLRRAFAAQPGGDGTLLGVSPKLKPFVREILLRAIPRLQAALYAGNLTGRYFTQFGECSVPSATWATPEGEAIIQTGFIPSSLLHQQAQCFIDAEQFGRFITPPDAKAACAPDPTTQVSRTRGPRPQKLNAVESAMRKFIAGGGDLASMKEEEMAVTFTASRDTCRKARDHIVSSPKGDN